MSIKVDNFGVSKDDLSTFWSILSDQTGLTGDKTGTFNLTTTGTFSVDSDSNGLKLGDDQDFLLYSDGAGVLYLKPVVADTDTTVNFYGTTKSGQLLWMEDEDYFQFNDDIYMNAENIITDTTIGMKIGTATNQKLGFYNTTPQAQSTGWSVTNEASDKVFDADATTIDELADVVGSLIETLKGYGLLGG